MAGDIPEDPQKKKEEYWLKNKVLIAGLLLIWAVSSFVMCVFLAKPLSTIYFFELPISFWFAQQGTMVLFVLLIFFYAWRMDSLDDRYDVKEVVLRDEEETLDVEQGEDQR